VTESDDQLLVSQLRAGRREACAELVHAHYERVYRFLVHLTRDVHLAEDLTQETFAVAWEKLSGFEGRSTLATWLHRIAYTKYVDSQRTRQRTENMLDRLATTRTVLADPLDVVAADDEARNLYRVLHRLDAPERTVIVLHYLQGLSYAEMAAVLDEPSGTVKWRTALALNRLRAILSEEVADHASRTT
jgi:RNA polymerase sigma-70 factor (ECF subfamily)